MNGPLAPLLADGVIDEICGRLRSGKEADLWMVRCGGEVVAAKVYKARQARTFRNNAGYKEGRQVRDTRTQRAMARGSRFGQAAAEEAWKATESDALHKLHAAGVRVPRPVLFYEGVLLMELVVDAEGRPAPRLVEAQVKPEDAAALYADLRGQVVRMLGCDLIHGDLSPYNVLLAPGGPVIIDFPQVVGAAHNSQAESFFQRDLENLRRFFAAADPRLGASADDAREIWRAYVRRELTPDFVPSGVARHAAPRREPHARPEQHGAPERHKAQRRGDAPRAHEHADRAQHASGPARDAARKPDSRQGEARPREARHAETRHHEARQSEPRQHDRRGHKQRPPAPQRHHDSQRAAAAAPAGRADRGGRASAPRPAPAPEVIRVTRPPLLPASPAPGSAQTAPAAHPAARRRRRRRR